MAVGVAKAAGARPAPSEAEESDFSPRKLKIASVVLLGSMFASSFMPVMAFTLVMLPMTKEFGWSRTEFSFALSLLMWFGACTAPLCGRFADKVGVRWLVIPGTIMVGLTTLALGFQTRNIWAFYACFALLGVFGSSAAGYSKIVAALFTKNRGKAMAVFGAETTLALAVMPQIVRVLMAFAGWRGAFFGLGAIILLIVPIVFFLMDEPGRERGVAAGQRPAAPALEGLTPAQSRRTPEFWIILGAFVLGAAPLAGLTPQIIPILNSHGFSQGTAVNILSILTLIAPAGSLLTGFMFDRTPSAKVLAPFILLGAVGIALQGVATTHFGGLALLILSGATIGLSMGPAQTGARYIDTRYFGLKAYAEISSIQMAVLAVASGFAPPAVAMIYDRTGSYNLAYVVIVACLIGAGLLYLMLGRYRYAANVGMVAALPDPEERALPIAVDTTPARLAANA